MLTTIISKILGLARSRQDHLNEDPQGSQRFDTKRIFRRPLVSSSAAVVVLTIVLCGAPVSSRAQSGGYGAYNRNYYGYWATNNCYYQHNGYRWRIVECQFYDNSLGAWVAANRTGYFYYHNNRWLKFDYRAYLTWPARERAITIWSR